MIEPLSLQERVDLYEIYESAKKRNSELKQVNHNLKQDLIKNQKFITTLEKSLESQNPIANKNIIIEPEAVSSDSAMDEITDDLRRLELEYIKQVKDFKKEMKALFSVFPD